MDSSKLWWRDGVIYQIYPRSFADSNGDGIGDLAGILGKLDYLEELGVDAIWLSPIYPSPDVDFGYDVSDYLNVAERFGTLADFDRLVAEAHRRGIRVVLDMVMNHTSDQHPWFQESRRSLDNPYRDYYFWRSPKPGNRPPNNWQSVFGEEGWRTDPVTGEMYFHMFYREQPDLNWRNPAVRQAMLDVFRFWLERGVDGFRLDVFNCFFKDAGLRDNPTTWFGLRAFERQQHLHDIDQPEMIPLLNELRALLDSYGERYAVGETFLASAEKAAGYCGPERLHGAFNFELLASHFGARGMIRAIQRWERALPAETWPTWVLNNHDTIRSATRYGGGENDDRLKLAAMLLLTQRGTPFLYYGEEIGMRDISVAYKDIQDRIGKKYWPIHRGRDGCRAPMQWNAEPNAGFSPAGVKTWLPPHPDYPTRNLEAQRADPHSLWHFYRKLIALRRNSPALREGMNIPLVFDTYFILAYLRQTTEETVLVALNFSSRRKRLVLGRQLSNAHWEYLLSSKREEVPIVKNGLVELQPYEALLMRMVSPL
jgi:alpha-glucosidase